MRVDRAFAFVDLCGFTAFTERHGDERAVLVLAQFRTALREVAARRGVRVVKWLGDGAMLSSTMPEALTALVIEFDQRMAAEIPSLALRAGLDLGPVIMFEGDDYIGRSVNVAARLCDAARAHEILATEAISRELPGWVDIDVVPRIEVRGIEGQLAVCRLSLETTGADRERDPVCGLTIARRHMTRSETADGWFCSEACATSTSRYPAEQAV